MRVIHDIMLCNNVIVRWNFPMHKAVPASTVQVLPHQASRCIGEGLFVFLVVGNNEIKITNIVVVF
jgi:hypothetical protein